MELNNKHEINLPEEQTFFIDKSTEVPFIEANTIKSSSSEIKERHVIPVFIKDNEPVISHADFIETMMNITSSVYAGETILTPSVRLSHAVKGRIPEARDKPAIDLLEHEKTVYYERMAFVIEIPTIQSEVAGNLLSLTVGGVKSYSLDNLYSRKGSDEHFKVFVGFQNKVCSNLCVWTDGFLGDLKVQDMGQLRACIRTLLEGYNAAYHIHSLQKLVSYTLTEQQFALLIGRCRMYNHLPASMKNEIIPLMLGDTQISTVVKDYYRDDAFCKQVDGNINLWRLYNLFTGANKSSYIDTFIDRNVNAFRFIDQIKGALDNKTSNWFLN